MAGLLCNVMRSDFFLVKVGENVIGLSEGDKVTVRYIWGAFAQYVTCNPFSVLKLPDDFPLLEASLLEILPGVLHTAELGEITPHKNVLITGQGVSGLILTQAISLLTSFGYIENSFKLAGNHHSLMRNIETRNFPAGFSVRVPRDR